MKKSPVQKITPDKLGQMCQREFLSLHQKIEEGFKETVERFEKIDERFERIDERFDIVDKRFDALIEILRTMRDDIKEIKSDVKTVGYDYLELRTRVERLEKKIGLAK